MSESSSIWEAATRLNLYTLSDEELEVLTGNSADPVITAAARYIVKLRRRLAAGEACD
jgi:hypothetical protein